jgi:RNA polymerase sigma factor (sigma-70 family)
VADRDRAKHGARIPQGTAKALFISIELLSKEDNETVEMDFPDTRLNPEESCRHQEIKERVHAEVSKLSVGCRRVIERCFFEEKSQIDTADALQINVATVKARVFRAKRALRRSLSARGKSWHNLRTPVVQASERTG